MDAMIVVDMQVGMLAGAPKHDLQGVISRINALAARVRNGGGAVIWIRHCGRANEDFAGHSPGWEFLPQLTRETNDIVVEKTLNDPYVGTTLNQTLKALRPDRVLVCGWATDFCVDATVRSSVSNGYNVVPVRDGHTLSDRPHLSARAVIEHHNWIWSELITDKSVRVATVQQLLGEAGANPDK